MTGPNRELTLRETIANRDNLKYQRSTTLLTCGIVVLSLVIAGCASRPYQGADIQAAAFLQRAMTQQSDTLRVTAAAPDAAETLALTGLDLYEQGIQPIWLEIKNTGPDTARIATWSIDRNYFSPIEVAYMNRKQFSRQGYAAMERWFYENGLQRRIPPGETRSGLVFSHLRPGTKAFNLDIYSNKQASSFTFFLPMPGFTPDYARVDFSRLYKEEDIRHLGVDELKTVLESALPCCATDVSGKLKHRFYEREPDAVFFLDREDGNERLQVNLWMAPWQVASEPVWVGQVFYRSQDDSIFASLRNNGTVKDSKLLSRYVGESVAADIDSAQRFMMQNFWYNHSLRAVGMVSGVGPSSVEEPQSTYDGFAYFTKGERTVLFLSEAPVAMDDGKILYTPLKPKSREADDV